jgi:hypothetical protein
VCLCPSLPISRPQLRFRNYQPRDAALKAGVVAPPPAPSALVEAAAKQELAAIIAETVRDG